MKDFEARFEVRQKMSRENGLAPEFDNIQLGKVHSGNVPSGIFSQIASIADLDVSAWRDQEEDGFVKIIAR